MFTDNPTIPAQLETLLEVVYELRERKSDRAAIRTLLQPQGLPGVRESSQQAELHIKAAAELELIKTDDSDNIRLNYRVRGEHQPRQHVLDAFDRVALGSATVELWAGRFYAFMIVQDSDTAAQGQDSQNHWALEFNNALPADIPRQNPMNSDKFRALIRWYVYSGLGWIDPAGAFVPDPTPRVERALETIFNKNAQLDSVEFMTTLSLACPELDGGALFNAVTRDNYMNADRRCTRALATALWRLHDRGRIRLICPADSKGWSLDRAGSGSVSGQASSRFDRIERSP